MPSKMLGPLYTSASTIRGAHCPTYSPILDEITLILATLIGGFCLIFVVVKFSGGKETASSSPESNPLNPIFHPSTISS